MLLPRNLLVLATAGAAFAGVLGCGGRPPAPGDADKGPPTGSPEAAFVMARDALRARDFGAIHDILSRDAKARAEAEVEKAALSAAAMGPLARELLGFDPAELGGLPAREKYVKVMKGACETGATLESAFRPSRASGSNDSWRRETGLAGGEVADAETDGDRATVTVKLPSGATRAMALVREDGAWKLADPLRLRGDAGAGPAGDEAGAGAAMETPAAIKAKPDAR